MFPSVVFDAPAKVNLFLEVVGKRPDGFHDLDTVFCEVALTDQLTLMVTAPGVLDLHCTDPALSCGPDNLIHRALAPLIGPQSLCGLNASLLKRIPAGGGLGGGSSDAAAALKAAESLGFLKESPEALAARALALGSDVPFFLEGGCQRGQGRGEILSPLPFPDLALVLCLPELHCSTPAVFQALELGEDRVSIEPMLAALEEGSPAAIAGALFNRLEEPAFELWPELAAHKQRLLDEGCLGAVMSGSGSTVFGIAENFAAAEAIAAAIPKTRAVRTRRPPHSPPK